MMKALLSTTMAWVLTVGLPVIAAAGGSEPPAGEGRPLDAATMAALGITESRPAEAARTTRPVAPESGTWSWTPGQYSYDGSGNIATIGTEASFLYDVRGRLVDANMTRAAATEHREYVYDPFGNRTSMKVGLSSIPTPTSTSTNHLTGLSAVYDVAGNVIQLQPPGQSTIYQQTYDGLGSLQEVKASNISGTPTQLYIYTADGERLWTFDLAANASHWKIRDLDGKVLRDYYVPGTTWTLSRDYVYRGKLLLAAVTPSETLHFSLDHLGTPRVITGANRDRVGFHYYLPFGEEWTDQSGAQEGETMKFTGHERDSDVVSGGVNGFDYMHARYYSANVGRFLSIDPGKDSEPLQPQSWNMYAYAGNNPVAFVDPDGLKTRLYTYVGFTNPGAKSELPTARSIRSELRTELGSRVVNHSLQMNPSASTADFRTGLTDSEGMSMFIGHAYTPGPGLKFDDAHSDWLQNVTNNNSVILLGACDSAGFAGQFGINSSTTGKAFVGFAGQVNSMVLAEMTTLIVKQMEKGKSIGDAVAAARAELTRRGVRPSDFRIVLVGDEDVRVTTEDLKTNAPR